MKTLQRRYGHMAPMAIDPIEGFEFKFYSKDKGEKPHVHAWRNGHKIKFWLGPPVVLVEAPHGFKRHEVRRAREIIEERWQEIYNKWNAFFGLGVGDSGSPRRAPRRKR